MGQQKAAQSANRKGKGAAPAALAPAPDAKGWPAEKIERRDINALKPYDRNARKHSADQVRQIAESIGRWGWTMPVLVDEAGGIIAGHGRIEAAKLLGLNSVPVMVARGWSDEQKRLYVIADNKLALNASWDEALLALEFGDLQDAGADLTFTGFEPDEIEAVFARARVRAGKTDPDETPEVAGEAVARPGDVWQLGEHRVTCGDCTDPEVVKRLLNGFRPKLMVTDPPYGVSYDPSWRNPINIARGHAPTKRTGEVLNDGRADWREAWALFPGDVCYVWHGGLHAAVVAESLLSQGFEIRAQIIWRKQRLIFSRGDYHWQHEPCWYAVRKGGTWAGDRKQSTVWDIEALVGFEAKGAKPEDERTVHGTQKPVECMRRPMLNNSQPGDGVYEPFLGSGSTLIAAQMEGRRCYGIELNPLYVDVVIRRWEKYSGDRARLEGGPSFAEIEAERLAPKAA